MAMFAPAVAGGSAKFYYEQRGLWALIMSQTGLGLVAGEQILTFIDRMGGTVLGAIIGMVAWYCGNGKGNGNRYGFVISTVSSRLILKLTRRLSGPPSRCSVESLRLLQTLGSGS